MRGKVWATLTSRQGGGGKLLQGQSSHPSPLTTVTEVHMPRRREAKPKHREEKDQIDRKLAEAIRRAQEQPGLADLWELARISEEASALAREQREASVATTIVSATASAG